MVLFVWRLLTLELVALSMGAALGHLLELPAKLAVLYCFEDQDVEDAANLMEERQVRRIPVLDSRNRLVGIVSLGDLSLGTRDSERIGRTLEEVSAPAEPKR